AVGARGAARTRAREPAGTALFPDPPVPALDAQLAADHPGLLQVGQDLRRHPGRQVQQRVVAVDVDAADVAAFQPGLVGDGADDVAGAHAVAAADLDAVGLHARLRLRAHLARAARRARVARRGAFAVTAGPRTARLARRTLARRLLGRLQQQRRVAVQQARQGRGHVLGGHLVLGHVTLHQGAVLVQAAGLQGAGDALEEPRHAAIVDRLHGRQAHLLDRLPGGALDRTQHALLARGDEQDRKSVV